MFVNLKRKAVVPDKFRVHVHPVPTIPETGKYIIYIYIYILPKIYY